MIVRSTELQNNFGKYLKLCKIEDVIVSKNGKCLAKLVFYDDEVNADFCDGIIKEINANYVYNRKKVTYEEFIEMTEISDKRYELIDGEVYMMTSPTVSHQKAQVFLFNAFFNWFKGEKCIPFVSPFDITLNKFDDEKNKNVVQPDIMVICDLDEKTNEKDKYMGTPALVVEILSKSTKRRDFVIKLDLYLNSGIREYWLVNPENREIIIYDFEDGEITSINTSRYGEIAESKIYKGLKMNVKEIFQ